MQAWDDFLKTLDLEFGKETGDKWLRSLKVVKFDACNIYLEAKDSFQLLWIEEHVIPRAAKRLFNNNYRPIQLHLTLFNALPPVPVKKKKTEPASSAPPSSLFPSDDIDPELSFDAFLPGSANLFSHRVLSELIGYKTPKPQLELATFNPIYVYGGSGVGKTHLLMAVSGALRERGLKVTYVRAETFTSHVVGAIRSGAMQDFRKTYRHTDVLVVDDIHVLAQKGATQEEFFHTFNALHTAGKQMIFSAHSPPQLLSAIEPRLISRFEWGIALPIEKLSLAEMKTMLEIKMRVLRFPLREEVIQFLLNSFQNSSKSLHRALDALAHRSHLHHIKDSRLLEVANAELFLKDLVEEENAAVITPSKIVRAVADFYGIRVDDILGKSQTRECALPRQIAMHLCRAELKMPYIKIGEFFQRDHSTVMTSVKQIKKGVETQHQEVFSSVSEILRSLMSVTA